MQINTIQDEGNSPGLWIKIQNQHELEEKKKIMANELEKIKTFVFTDINQLRLKKLVIEYFKGLVIGQ